MLLLTGAPQPPLSLISAECSLPPLHHSGDSMMLPGRPPPTPIHPAGTASVYVEVCQGWAPFPNCAKWMK
ncbi:hypothetical protein PsorP6_008752 [Peronosclerospora sorghi]|uniref:Uncharacterized protein n=1 Tax=Peronosclerospora sorghi TaxID=230839 RepID=A0ACC0W0Y0_9STRA|nr:hypothetical protein PsorP6_008752 [Peronosclerospora sorghi]